MNKVEQLEKACDEWAEVSQQNYVRAKHYRQALETISNTRYGLQSIMEDHNPGSKAYYKEAMKYYSSLASYYKKVANEALLDGR